MCNQCEAVTINGIYCHEHGCPNALAICSRCKEEFIPQYNGDHICRECHDDDNENIRDQIDACAERDEGGGY